MLYPMSEMSNNAEFLTLREQDAGLGLPEIEPRDYLYQLDFDFDVDAQLIAIRGLLRRNNKATQEMSDEIREIEEHTRRLKGIRTDRAIDEWMDRLHDSAYQDAAHSMSAVGMLAPLIETIFYQFFRGIGKGISSAKLPSENQERWKAIQSIQWDCRLIVQGKSARKDLVRGIFQLCNAVGLTSKLPPDLELTLSALFAYRNKMFHNGFEWPIEEREHFLKQITEKKWPSNWFFKAEYGDKPWIFYLKNEFIEHCLGTIEKVLVAMGTFVRDDLSTIQSAS
jgi:hypothetical protein